MIGITSSGSFRKTLSFLHRLGNSDFYSDLDRYGRVGVNALSGATPVRSGATAAAWNYNTEKSRSGFTMIWTNSNVNKGSRIALLIQYGHGTGTGGYVAGYDYINPAIRPIFDQIEIDVWRRVTDG
jgi:hypothetical protein